KNIEKKLVSYPEVKVERTQGRLFIILNDQEPEPIITICKDIFGIYSLSLAIKVDSDLSLIKEAAKQALTKQDDVTTFKVSVKRANKEFPITSQEMNQILGAHILKNTSGYTV